MAIDAGLIVPEGAPTGGCRSPEPDRTAHEDPLTILEQRLARGEVTVEEYERIRAILERDRAGAPAPPAQPGHRHHGC